MAGFQRSLAAVAFAITAGGLVASCGVNTIPTDEEKAKAAWSEVQNQYQRRADLIPNLVETVRGYAKQEEKVLTEVTQARAQATSIKVDASTITDPDKFQQFQNAQQGLSGALGRLIAVSEAYPDLKSNQNFMTLQSQLEGTENRIAVARKDYIEAVRVYNTDLRTFPQSIYKSMFYSDAKPMESFSTAPENQAAPKVNFNNN